MVSDKWAGADLLPASVVPRDRRRAGDVEDVEELIRRTETSAPSGDEGVVHDLAVLRTALFRLLTKDNPAYANRLI